MVPSVSIIPRPPASPLPGELCETPEVSESAPGDNPLPMHRVPEIQTPRARAPDHLAPSLRGRETEEMKDPEKPSEIRPCKGRASLR